MSITLSEDPQPDQLKILFSILLSHGFWESGETQDWTQVGMHVCMYVEVRICEMNLTS